MKVIDLKKFPYITYGKNVKIEAELAIINPGVHIGDNVNISAKILKIGYDTIIEKDVTVRGLGIPMELFELGDNCFVGFSNQILVYSFIMRDYSQLHNSGLHSGYKDLEIGYNCWIGQNSILNSTESLHIHNNVRIGTGSQLWTHVASGELYEGCTLYGNKPLVLEDDVWIVGGAVISPGLTLRKKSIIMTGSVLTKSTEERHTYAGVPAKDLTEKMNFWVELDYKDKLAMLMSFIKGFTEMYKQYEGKLQIIDHIDQIQIQEGIIFLNGIPDEVSFMRNKYTFFDIKNKFYLKNRTKIEIDWIKYCVGFRMRFIPLKTRSDDDL